MKKLSVLIDKPIYVGSCILDISKTLIYSFHYDYILPKFKDNVQLLYTDTDSLIYKFTCDDFYEIMKEDLDKYDTSDFPENNVYGIPRINKKVLGKMKDENCGCLMAECVCLRSKMYGIRMDDESEQKKAKGVKTSVVKRTITFDDYLDCLRECKEISREQNCIRAVKHNVYTIREKKIALSPFDTKRYLQKGTTDTLPWGHYKIMDDEQ